MLQSQYIYPRIYIPQHLQVFSDEAIQNSDHIHSLLFIQHEVMDILDQVDDHFAELYLVSDYLCIFLISFLAVRVYKILVLGTQTFVRSCSVVLVETCIFVCWHFLSGNFYSTCTFSDILIF